MLYISHYLPKRRVFQAVVFVMQVSVAWNAVWSARRNPHVWFLFVFPRLRCANAVNNRSLSSAGLRRWLQCVFRKTSPFLIFEWLLKNWIDCYILWCTIFRKSFTSKIINRPPHLNNVWYYYYLYRKKTAHTSTASIQYWINRTQKHQK